MSRTVKATKPKTRNASVLAAKRRKSGEMKHRLEPKGGAKNEQAELLAELDETDGPPTSMPIPMNEDQVRQFIKENPPTVLDDNEEEDDYC